MASTPALLNFQFDSTNTDGCYRVMSRIQGSGDPYVETPVACTPFVPPTLSVPCTVQIGINVDDETCAAVTYEGYVQPCCQEVASLEGRVPFTVTFTPNPTCKSYLLTCNSTGIQSIIVDVIGTGYTPGPNVPITFGDPSGSLAAGDCRIEDGGIKIFSETTAGTGGVNGIFAGVQVLVSAPSPGTPVNAYVDYTVAGGVVTAIALTSLADELDAPGADYIVGNTFTLPGAWGVNPVYTVDVVNTGEILLCTMSNPGAGYVGPTTATVAAAGLEVAPSLIVEYAPCDPVTLFGIGCPQTTPPNDPTPDLQPIILGSTVQICRQGDVGLPPSNMSIVAGGCCADPGCETYTITALPGYEGNFSWVDCCTTEMRSTTTKGFFPGDPAETVNALVGSLTFYPPGSEALLTIVGPTPYVCP